MLILVYLVTDSVHINCIKLNKKNKFIHLTRKLKKRTCFNLNFKAARTSNKAMHDIARTYYRVDSLCSSYL